MIQSDFSLNLSSDLKGEDCFNEFKMTDGCMTDDRHQVKANAHNEIILQYNK